MTDKGKQILSTILTVEKNINLFDKKIGEIYEEKDHEDVMYQVIGELITGKKVSETFECVKRCEMFWENSYYDSVRTRIMEKNDFIENPFEVEEGVCECRCGSKRVITYAKQTRGGDESTSTFATCIACKSSWVYSG